jgi:chromosome segregation ATPase
MEINNMSDKQTLYDITNAAKELNSILENLEFEELTDEAKAVQRQAILDSLEGLGLEQKLEAYCQVIAEKKANNDYLSAEIARLQKRKKSNDTTIDWLRGNMQSALIAVNKQKVDTGLHKISISKRTTLEIDYDKLIEQGIPEVIYKPAVIDKTATKKAIQGLGVELEGVQEVEKTSIRIT